mmetsp:Transcript_73237/g.174542  ORF Transcript_73237/g.174542 Transcript_73237/m.174542 type:complete len:86 (-) Transcript_73237:78-335(-)
MLQRKRFSTLVLRKAKRSMKCPTADGQALLKRFRLIGHVWAALLAVVSQISPTKPQGTIQDGPILLSAQSRKADFCLRQPHLASS